MKNTIKITSALVLAIMLVVVTAACSDKAEQTDLWENAVYLSDTTLGEGENTVEVELTTQEKTIMFTINTDKPTLGQALYELELVNDPEFFDVCNGIKADWDKDNAYWALYVGNDMAQYGIGDERAVTTDEPTYKIVYTK